MLDNLDPKIFVAIIAAITSFCTFVLTQIFKNPIEKRFHKFKLTADFENEQKKKIKTVISEHKVPLIDTAQNLNGRFKNLMIRHDLKWHFVNGDYTKDNYFFKSFIYRVLALLAWVKLTEKSLIFLDTTIATERDLFLIKYLKLIYRTLQYGKLTTEFDGLYDLKKGDVIYRDQLDDMAISLIKDKSYILTYSEFKEKLGKAPKSFMPLCQFIDSVSPNEDRKRWDRLCCLHLTVMCFLNSYGYDFQYSSEKNIKKYLNLHGRYHVYENFIKLIIRYKLEEENEMKNLIRILNEHIEIEKKKKAANKT